MLTNIASLGFTRALIIFITVIVSVSIHEFSHAFTAHLRGDDTAKYNGRLTINPVAHFEPVGFLMMLFTNFGWGKPVPINPGNMENPRRDNLLVAIAGPISNLLVALIAAIALRLVFLVSVPASLGDFVSFILVAFISINVGLAVFNLLPFPPLDGSNIYRPFLPYSVQEKLSRASFEYIIVIFILAFLPIFNGQSLISFIISPIISLITGILLP